ncbi:MAG: ParA family protein [Ktedonobacteraceae bacterium]|nr:ParA family protein [Ktedonobacteraceae bacterium]
MAYIITIINFKGGVGKTTTAIELSTSLARHYGRRSLLIDLDPQASATFYVMEQERWKQWKDVKGTTYDLFQQRDGGFPVRNAIVHDVIEGPAAVPGFDLLPSNPELVDVDLSLTDFVSHNILQRYLDEIRQDYDYVICDCPPNFNPVTRNSLWASDAYVVPTVPDFLSTYGIGLLQRSVNKLFTPVREQQHFSGPILGGIILTRIKTQVVLHNYYCEQVRLDYPGKVFKHTISDSIRVASAADDRLPISALPNPRDQQATLQEQFKNLAGEFISRIYHLCAHK